MAVRQLPSIGWTILATALLAAATGCGGPSGINTGNIDLVPSTSGTNASNADLAAYDEVGHWTPIGGSVTLPDGTAVSASIGALSANVQIGIRPASGEPIGDHAATAISAWTEAEVSALDVEAVAAAPFVFEVPATPPADAIGHPGLQLTLVLPGGQSFPVDGTYDPGTGRFRAKVLALPPRFAFAVTFLGSMSRLDSSEVADEATGSSLTAALDEGSWSTVEFVIDFDGQAVTMEQARKVARAARTAARLYSANGFKEPFLYKEPGILGERWHIHLTNKGSNFNSSHNPAAADDASRFGRLFVSVARIDAAGTDDLGSVQASVAHEMFHSILFNYKLPHLCFNYVSDGQTWCYRSYSGFNEGAATAVGYAIDQGEARPRPSEAPFPLYAPLGYFDPNSRHMAYRNQDFFVYLLRIGGLSNVERLLQSLQSAVLPAAGANTYEVLSAYDAALEAGGVGLDVGFTEMIGGYTANRGFLREPEGYIWPDEPNGGAKGARFVLDRSLFGPVVYEIDPRDCGQLEDEETIDCTAELKGMAPMSGGLVTIDIASLAEDYDITPDTVTASAETPSGGVAFWVVGESEGAGAEEGYANAMAPAEASLPGGGVVWPKAHVLVGKGAGEGDVTVHLQIGAGAVGMTFEGSGTVVETFSPPDGLPGVCTQTVPMTLEVDHLPGWVELDYTARDRQLGLDGSNGTCTLLETTWDNSLWTNQHPAGSFTLGQSSIYPPWLEGTYDKDRASGYGREANDQNSVEITFQLVRKR